MVVKSKKIISVVLSIVIVITLFAGISVTANASKASKVKKKLTSKTWICYKCKSSGTTYTASGYYGSMTNQSGAYIKFKKNKKFTCNLGFDGCSGTYKVKKSGKVILHIKKEWNGCSDSFSANKTRKLKVSKKAISFKMFGAKNYFKKRTW